MSIDIQTNDRFAIEDPPPYFHGDFLVRGNVLRHVDGERDPAFQALAILSSGARKALISDNVIDLLSAAQLRDYYSGEVRYENNRTSSGEHLLGID